MIFPPVTRAVISLLSATALVQALSTQHPRLNSRATICNGHAEFCERSYGNITYVGAHNSYAVGVNNLAVNQDYNITQQLNDGVRLLQMQAHVNQGVINLCHTSCALFNGGTLQDYLVTVKTWMVANPNDVVTLLIVNSDNRPASEYGTIFTAAGVDTLSYAPPSSPIAASAWPTLGSLIDSNKRLVTFLDNGADLTSVPYLIDEFTNIWETAFNVIDTASFNCSIDRTKGETATQMGLINHFLDHLVFNQPVPFVEKANQTNGVSGPGSLGEHVNTCAAINTRPPNFLLVDFYEYGGGSVFNVAASANGVTYNPTQPIATPLPTDSSAPSASSNGNGNTKNGTSNAVDMYHNSLIQPFLLLGLTAGVLLVV